MCNLIALSLTLCSVLVRIIGGTSSFDQRQTGDLNVQIGLKNINIIALLKGGKEEYVDYDYAYDYAEMTIKPPNGTTSKPLNATSTTINTETQHNVNTSTTGLLEQTTEPIVKSRTNIAEVEAEVALNSTAEYSVVTATKTAEDIITTSISPDSVNNTGVTAPTTIKCRRGFVQNNEGKCEYKVHGTTNALRKIVKLAQKIKIGREYGES